MECEFLDGRGIVTDSVLQLIFRYGLEDVFGSFLDSLKHLENDFLRFVHGIEFEVA